MKTIPLTQDKVAMVDDEDYDLLSQWKWCAHKSGKELYYAERGVYNSGTGKVTCIKMHRLIMNASPDQKVDHIDHNTLNNQKSNLRLCSHMENCSNTTSRKGASKYMGVFWNKKLKKWQAQIGVNYKRKHLGLFVTENEAGIAYNNAAIENFGEFANLNIIT